MVNVELIDYADPMIRVEQGLRAMHKALLVRDHDAALAHALNIIVEAKLAYNAILHIKETNA